MKTKFVLVAKNEEGVRIFGVYHDRAYAERIAGRINERIERAEDKEFAAWQRRNREAEEQDWSYGEPVDMAPDGYGRVGVLVIHRPDVDRAYRFALGENDA